MTAINRAGSRTGLARIVTNTKVLAVSALLWIDQIGSRASKILLNSSAEDDSTGVCGRCVNMIAEAWLTEELLLNFGAPAEAIQKGRLLGDLGGTATTNKIFIEWNVDSGAAVIVSPRDVGIDYPMEDKKPEMIYRNDSGGKMVDEGARHLWGRSAMEAERWSKATKPLLLRSDSLCN